MISNESQHYPNSYTAAGSSSHGWGLELGCQCRLEGVAQGLQQQLSDWQLLITATRQNRTVKYYRSMLNFSFSHPPLQAPLQPLLQAGAHQKPYFEIITLGCVHCSYYFCQHALLQAIIVNIKVGDICSSDGLNVTLNKANITWHPHTKCEPLLTWDKHVW